MMLRAESFGLNHSINTPEVCHRGMPVSVFFTQRSWPLILSFFFTSLLQHNGPVTPPGLQTGINLIQASISGSWTLCAPWHHQTMSKNTCDLQLKKCVYFWKWLAFCQVTTANCIAKIFLCNRPTQTTVLPGRQRKRMHGFWDFFIDQVRPPCSFWL